MEKILKNVCKAAGVTENDIRGRSRKQHIAVPRHVFVHYAFKAEYGRASIALFINRTHSTVRHSLQAYNDLKGHFKLLDNIDERYLKTVNK
jgi:chromosomal replication initiation ATPase DnaA